MLNIEKKKKKEEQCEMISKFETLTGPEIELFNAYDVQIFV